MTHRKMEGGLKMFNFQKAVMLAQKGFKIRRLQWEGDACAWWNDSGIMLHTHPYDERQRGEALNGRGYDFILTSEDARADDWVII
jgi:hypothetical protein